MHYCTRPVAHLTQHSLSSSGIRSYCYAKYVRVSMFSASCIRHVTEHMIACSLQCLCMGLLSMDLLNPCFAQMDTYQSQKNILFSLFSTGLIIEAVDAQWKHLRPGWMRLWETWSDWSCPCSLQGGWSRWPSKVPSNPTILCFYDSVDSRSVS